MPLIFGSCILRKESGVKYAPEIRTLIEARLDLWDAGKICSLVSVIEHEATSGTGRRLPAGDMDMDEYADTIGQKYESMIQSGKYRDAVHQVSIGERVWAIETIRY